MVVRYLRSPMEVLLSCVAMEGGSNRWRYSLHLVRCSRWRDDGGSQVQVRLDVRSRFAQIKCRLWICVDGERCRCCLGGCRSRRCCCCYGTQAAVAVPELTVKVVLLSVTRWLSWRLVVVMVRCRWHGG
ncbi:hypothetical protein DEO72_LG7g2402 [Vigna unguiculata]|uniref:Uncharacterized protein n=1 Tax=Vigna unguiculata TaxID=3917 RepID=A0A4D6MLV6_VIGUN|nr:hypothetical protein DEO72_LG7g2402 [Vigna unguiculata]